MLDKLKLIREALCGLTIPATYENMNILLGSMQALDELIEQLKEGEPDVQD